MAPFPGSVPTVMAVAAPLSDDEKPPAPTCMGEVERCFDDSVSHKPNELAETMSKVPRERIEEVIKKSREAGAAAFKRKEWQQAYEMFNQAVYACSQLEDPQLGTLLGNELASLHCGHQDRVSFSSIRGGTFHRTCAFQDFVRYRAISCQTWMDLRHGIRPGLSASTA